jgi:hypothetical protein
MRIPTAIVPSVACAEASPAQTARDFRRLLASGVVLRSVGSTRRDPHRLLRLGYGPRHRFELFDTAFWLSGVRQNWYVRYFVAYVVQRRTAHARIFYKDASLIWRAASHVGRQHGQFWIGKGDVVTVLEDGVETTWSRESTTDLPLEMQPVLEELNRGAERIPTDEVALERVLRRAPEGRIEAYRDFTGPRRRAAADPRNRIHGGRAVAWFTHPGDPSSLRFARGYEPDFAGGVLETGAFRSSLYGGEVDRFRILSRNRRIQYLFLAAPRHVWIVPPQALTTELSSFGVRTVDVVADEDLFLPGFEYHFLDDTADPPVLYSQIPAGWAGPVCPKDDTRADAAPWLDHLPIVQEFRRRVLRARRPRAARRAG